MRTLAFDGRMGAAGDMILGALLSAGADRDALGPVEQALDVEYVVSTVDRNGIGAAGVEVLLTDPTTDGGEGDDEHGSGEHSHDHGHSDGEHGHEHTHGDQSHGHEHTHGDQSHGHEHTHGDQSHGHEHTHAEGHGPHRTYPEVVDIVDGMALPDRVEADALAIFEILGEAEAAVHGTDLDETHFHEVGADDAIADVVGAALLLVDLDVERVVTTPLSAGGGTVSMSHGTYPVPTPAVVEIAERADWALRGGPVDTELLTPTGAAILAHVAEGVDRLPSLTVDRSGYGAGAREFADHPNVLRAMVGDGAGGLRRDDITVLETNLDDAPPEVLGDLQRSLSEAGARDVSIVPLTMKKSRPGHLVKVICKPGDADRVARRLAEETGTLGIRAQSAGHRWVAERRFETAALDIDGASYDVGVKVASDTAGEVYDVSAEFDDAAAVAAATDLPVRAVIRRAEEAVRE
ncbi:nickel pincer cofactor biosynthesis protein LarC [Haloarcula onubensis]|uniref:Putative nickel insertion protein n=1 Tax=Haloarcula onubensis TaxID=2950539 RepID=A0ABU2FTC0_9EURY|nr:nickel pincer cofactor biosynthesis protein LarC [Halomicroarcula sp. S3CR25-11]MDS0283507.1 nickel pincer cofactor biosynthesis protein LarC [Halomicroarcula sp. S3CR25-11]